LSVLCDSTCDTRKSDIQAQHGTVW